MLGAYTSRSHFLKPLMLTIVTYVNQALITAVSWEKFFSKALPGWTLKFLDYLTPISKTIVREAICTQRMHSPRNVPRHPMPIPWNNLGAWNSNNEWWLQVLVIYMSEKQKNNYIKSMTALRDKGRNCHWQSYIEQSPIYSHMCYLYSKHRIQGFWQFISW